MIEFPGYEAIISRVYENHQEHVFQYWDELDDSEKKLLLDDLAEIDFTLLNRLYTEKESAAPSDFEPAPYIGIPMTDEERREWDRARSAGVELARAGRVAAFVVAGGQGSRLGYEGPKGKFPIGPVSGKTLFQIHAEKIMKYARKYGASIPFLIMTSRANHAETEAYFRENRWFGLAQADVIIFPQNMIPSLDTHGKLMLETKHSVFKNPDGHGGSLTALHTSGALTEMKKRGVEIISYFQVDNPLVRIIDPVFIGFHALKGADASSKAVRKAYPEEKVGVFVRFARGAIGVVEYSDLPEEKTRSVDAKGNLRYSSGSVAIHIFRRKFIERIADGKEISLPFHTARKKIRTLAEGAEREVDGLKFEKFVFDALPLTDKNIVFETLREAEFAPVKNASGLDSVESAQRMMIEQHMGWLRGRGIRMPAKARVVEISPLVAVEAEDLDPGLAITDEEKVYIDENAARSVPPGHPPQ
ncbi:MAG: UDPGP type 1 family protein [Spirochaetes bacterium]|nr:UDPGP type 1 family protein [Spirochaetota bacterium]